MLTYATYKLLHLAAIFLLLTGVGGLWALKAAAGGAEYPGLRKLLMAVHGVAMFLVLLGGFGTLARLGISMPWPAWIWIKLGVWLVMGGLPALLSRGSGVSRLLLFLAPLLTAVAAWAAINQVGG